MEAFLSISQSKIHSHSQALELTTLIKKVLEIKEFKSVLKIILLLNDIKKECKKKSPL